MKRYLILSIFAVAILDVSCKNSETNNENTTITTQHEDSLRNKVLNDAGKMLDTSHTGSDTAIRK